MGFKIDGYYKCNIGILNEAEDEVFIEKPKGTTPCKLFCYSKNCKFRKCNYHVNYLDYSNDPGDVMVNDIIFIKERI